jgi:hypothetical protein
LNKEWLRLSYLEIAFPGLSDVISAGRNSDATFDEICRDFEGISSMLENLKSKNECEAADLTNSAKGLHEEITQHLEIHKSRRT